jgi:hypothetical protein
MTEHVWFCIKCGVIGKIQHGFTNYFDVLLASNRDHVQVAAELGSHCRSLIGFGRMLALAAGEQ